MFRQVYSLRANQRKIENLQGNCYRFPKYQVARRPQAYRRKLNKNDLK